MVHPGVELTGTLSDDGTDMMHAIVYTNPVRQPPPELHGLVTAVHDPGGTVCDWRLAPVQASLSVTRDDIEQYRHWRSQFARETFIGERALVLAFLDWAGHRYDVSGLRFLHSHTAYVDHAHVLKLKLQLDRLLSALSNNVEEGFGLHMPPAHRSAARAVIATDPPTTLLATRDASVSVGRDGLLLGIKGAHDRWDRVVLLGWRVEDGGVVAITDGGERPLSDGSAAWLLRALGRDQAEVEVRPARVASLLAPTLMFLRDAADTAMSCHTGLSTRTGLS